MTEKLGNPFKISELVETVNNLVDTTYDDSKVVHKTGTETINGTKTFTNTMITDNILPKGDITLGTSTNTWGKQLQFRDTTGKRIARIQPMAIDTTNNRVGMWVNNADNSVEEVIAIDSNGITHAPTPIGTTSTGSREIATVGWVNSAGNNVVHKTGDETITGVKIFSGNNRITALQNSTVTYNTAPSSDTFTDISFRDKNGYEMGVLEHVRYPNNDTAIRLVAKGADGEWSTSLSVGRRANGTVYTSAQTPSAGDNSTNIATTAWVKNQGYMSSGNIFPNNTWVPVGDDAYIGDHNNSGSVCIKGNNGDTAIYLYRRDETASNGFCLVENDANGLKIINPTQGAQAWGAVTAMIAESYGSNGYIKFNHGLIIQWLYFAVSNHYVTVTFPTSFSNTNYAIVQTPISNNGTFPGGAWTGIRDKTMTNVKLGIRAGAGVAAETSYSHAIAIGY